LSRSGEIYEFVYRGHLADEALDHAGRHRSSPSRHDHEAVADALSLRLLDDELVAAADRMATVYTAVAAFENSVRSLVSSALLEEFGDNWWDTCVSSSIRNRAEKRSEDEEKHRFHTQRGDSPINYTELKDLLNIIRANWSPFEAHIPTPEWAGSIFDAVERSRNVIMHSGTLDDEDIARVGINIRDWVKQVGA
jgi:hypothetical protein